jgi:hypothetical protein
MAVRVRSKALAFAALAFLSRSALATVDVTDCGQVVPAGETGVLQADLDCAATNVIAGVLLRDGATLDLNGHTLSGGKSPLIVGVASDAARSCAIVGPGVISGSSEGVACGRARMSITDVTLEDNGYAIDASLCRLTLTNVTSSSTVSGISAKEIRASNVNVTVNGNGNCIMGKKVFGSDITVSGCHTGVTGQTLVDVQRLDARDNMSTGVVAGRVRLVDSVVTGNYFFPGPLDTFSKRRPELINTQCDVSMRWRGKKVGPTWGVCAND